ncbi:hypothetical protein TD95_004330 [Thielaviopsis punctulata]|uniref:FAD-binding PCMH-type domain-containing protein n=1 Tax=Thielaviopsis punctulata TaxID=72032 RepID=A0A0F4ZK80_9PEZI|nr:hypothetical protein TD95_004330 [Thielaviopsis punctulata]
MKRSALFTLASLALVVHASDSPTCNALDNSGISTATSHLSISYLTETAQYWSTLCSKLKPSCILWPETPADVSSILQQLALNNESFAVKSGGHNPNRGWSSVNDGVLIAMDKFDEVTLDAVAKTVRVGAGQKWGNVMDKLDGTNFTVVGGRLSDVGVGGYILGGGLSFLSTQYGWAANNVLEFEMVLPNGTITSASSTQNVGLFNALRGGGNNFGIVTTYIMRAHHIGDIWGGNYIFFNSEETETKLLAAVRDFTEYYPDPKAAIILTHQQAIGVVSLWTMFLFYDGAQPPVGVFDNFTCLNPAVDTTQTRSYKDLLDANSRGSTEGLVFTIGTETLPNPSTEHGAEVLAGVQQAWRTPAQSVQDVVGAVANIAYQPIPRMLAEKAQELKGDMLNLPADVDRIMLDINYGHLLPVQYDRIEMALMQSYENVNKAVANFTAQGKLKDVFKPLFMDDGFYKQDIFGRYAPEKRQLAQKVAAEVDPTGLFKTRTGGFKP